MHKKQILIVLILLASAILIFYALKLFLASTPKEIFNNNTMKIYSPDFASGGFIPAKYTCDGQDINPHLKIEGVPEGAQSLALIIDDPDAPIGDWVHWILWNIDAKTTNIAENSVPIGAQLGYNDFKRNAYGGPCPPNGVHNYHFKLFALDIKLDTLSPNTNKQKFLDLIKGHIIDTAELVGKYSR